MRKFLNRRGQSTTEYILVLALLAAIVFFLRKPITEKVKSLMNNTFDKINDGNSTSVGNE